jgi:riboflavin synthase
MVTKAAPTRRIEMFTGIVQGTGEVTSIADGDSVRRFSIKMCGLSDELKMGASVSVDGVCLTATGMDGSTVDFDAVPETLERSTLGGLDVGDSVNLERALRMGDELGGHVLSGHIMATAEVLSRTEVGEGVDMGISISSGIRPFVMEKGFIAVDGISLTVGSVRAESFDVHLIPETLERTTIGSKTEGALVNIEVDPMTQAVVLSRVSGIKCTSNDSALTLPTVRLIPSTAMKPFSITNGLIPDEMDIPMSTPSPTSVRLSTSAVAMMCPDRTCPPNSSPIRRARSRFTESPTSRPPSVERSSVSGTASKSTVLPSIPVAVRQTPSTDTLAPISSSLLRSLILIEKRRTEPPSAIEITSPVP